MADSGLHGGLIDSHGNMLKILLDVNNSLEEMSAFTEVGVIILELMATVGLGDKTIKN